MISPMKAVTITAQAAEHRANQGVEWAQAAHHTIRTLIDRLAEARGYEPPRLDRPACPAADTSLDELGSLDDWHITDLGDIHQRLLELTPTRRPDGTVRVNRRHLGQRGELGSYYTPTEVARAMCELSIGPQLARLARDPDPYAVLNVMAIDPACGAGVFLTEASVLIASALAVRLGGPLAGTGIYTALALPEVMRECIFGMDIDPVAVDIAKTALWLQIGARGPWTFMNRNIICADPLAGPNVMPPAWLERTGGAQPDVLDLNDAA